MRPGADRVHFIVQGTSLDTGNLGVSALLAGTVKCIREAYPRADISLMEGARHPPTGEVHLAGGEVVRLGVVGVRRNKTLWRRNHLLRLLITAWLVRLVVPASLRRRLLERNPYLEAIASAQCVADITGGDSFSDIYGIRRLTIAVLHKLLVLAVSTDLVLLPQTYGPFKSRLARWLARPVLARAAAIFTRDAESIAAIERLMGSRKMRAAPEVSSDVAFILDAIPPARIETAPSSLDPESPGELIGLNVSGLLYNGGYTRSNMFSLSLEYPRLVLDIARDLLARTGARILLVPHVFMPPGCVESDPEACERLFQVLDAESPGRVLLLRREYDQSGIKYIIGLCSFFLGSRMHACIAAASQGIPTVPLAYSRKFAGVFGSIGAADLVADMRAGSADDVRRHVLDVYDRRAAVAESLRRAVHLAQARLRETFRGPLAAPAGRDLAFSTRSRS
ncbi:MAG: polysaccharide pyruvyl transferase family protein [Planctomycetes bacterium]|nr:polysaccharide pyruvyl transferase family protein [Planctomycetota bacterium]